MAILLSLLSAASYGASDFLAGLASRKYVAGAVACCTQIIGLITVVLAVAFFPGSGLHAGALEWGALAGLGSAVGTFALYRGFAVGRMSIVATTSAVLTAAIPLLVGIALGNHLSTAAAVGIVIAVPAITLVSWHPEQSDQQAASSRLSVICGLICGFGFALLFIALDRAGTRSGAWPLVACDLVSFVLLIPTAVQSVRAAGRPELAAARTAVLAGALAAAANILYFVATGKGELSIVAVLSALYPALTVILARLLLAEHWSRLQAAGLITAALAVALIAS